MNKTMTAVVGVVLALALVTSACGGGGSVSSADQPIVDAIVAQMREEGDVPESVDIDCMAVAVVSGLGGAEVMEAEYGLTVESINAGQDPNDVELPRDDAIELASDAMDCGIGNIMLEEMAGDGLSEDEAKCLFDSLDKDLIRDLMATSFMNDADAEAVESAAEDELLGSLFGAVTSCDLDPSIFG